MAYEYISEQRQQYTKKNIDTNALRNPPIKCNALKFIKPFENSHLRLAPKPLQESKSINKNDYRGELQVQAEKTSLIRYPGAVENSEVLTIDRSKPGYSKYLDLSATSNRLDYYPISFDQQRGIAAKDNITYWTWIKNDTNKVHNVWPIKQNLSDNFRTNKKSKGNRGEFQIIQNSVPNNGLTTETKSNFKNPDKTLEFNINCISDQLDSQ
ncbi:uncharacterized protein LOC129921425 [Episyrphus balteatus]|uniref:uncharacterized protein LOC129921425 n=1 Tax=Episyrphus balteatus TaxID=286459 RepID=UPI002486CD0E|nr:uncharacterized protein LOC129921425 [Episyrphus balteatus]